MREFSKQLKRSILLRIFDEVCKLQQFHVVKMLLSGYASMTSQPEEKIMNFDQE
jgi:hypothetical protein